MFFQWFKGIHIVNFKQCLISKVPQNMALSASRVLDKLADRSREFGWLAVKSKFGASNHPTRIAVRNSRFENSDFEIWEFGFWNSDFRFLISDIGFQISNFVFQILDLRYRISDFSRFWISDFKYWISNFGFKILDLRFWI